MLLNIGDDKLNNVKTVSEYCEEIFIETEAA